MGYDQYTVPDNVVVEPTFVAFLQHSQTYVHGLRVILSNFFEEQLTQNHPQFLSGLSRALFPTTSLEIAVHEQFTVQARFPSHSRSQRGLISQPDDSRNRFTKSLYPFPFISLSIINFAARLGVFFLYRNGILEVNITSGFS